MGHNSDLGFSPGIQFSSIKYQVVVALAHGLTEEGVHQQLRFHSQVPVPLFVINVATTLNLDPRVAHCRIACIMQNQSHLEAQLRD